MVFLLTLMSLSQFNPSRSAKKESTSPCKPMRMWVQMFVCLFLICRPLKNVFIAENCSSRTASADSTTAELEKEVSLELYGVKMTELLTLKMSLKHSKRRMRCRSNNLSPSASSTFAPLRVQ